MAATDSAAIEVVSPEGRSAGLRDRLPPAATSRSKGRRPRVARMKRLHGFPARAMFDAAHAEWGRRYRLIDQPDDISLGGVRLHLSEPWATPEIRRAIYEGWYEQTERTILQHTLRPDDRYLEVGAGTGLVTTCACKIVGAEKVVAYEGDPRLANQARETAARNGFVADVVNAVLGAGDGETTFYVDADFRASSLLALENAREIRVPVRSFAAALDRHRPTYLMVDIEGGEIQLLASALPAHVRAVCVETHPAVTGDEAKQAMLMHLMRDGFQLDLHESHNDVAFFAR